MRIADAAAWPRISGGAAAAVARSNAIAVASTICHAPTLATATIAAPNRMPRETPIIMSIAWRPRRPHDQVELPVFVLEQHEYDSVRGGRPLPRNDHSCDGDVRRVRLVGERFRRKRSRR